MKRLLLIFLLGTQAFGLKALTSSVAFTDAQGNPMASGYLVFNLSGPANLIAGGQIAPVPPIRINLGVAGTVVPGQSIEANDEMQPTGTFYIVRLFNVNNVVVRGPENWILSGGAPIDLSGMINVLIPDPGLANLVLQNPSASQTITGQSLTLTSSAPLTVQGNLVASGASTLSGSTTLSGNITGSGTNTWSGANTFSSTLTSSGTFVPGSAGGTNLGSLALPFGNLFFGTAATNNFELTGTATGTRTITAPDTSGTISYPVMQDCTTVTACANTVKANWFIIRGDVAFPTATTVVLTQLPFTSSTSYSCTASDLTTAAGVINATTYTSGASVTFTETNGTNTDHTRYICVGF